MDQNGVITEDDYDSISDGLTRFNITITGTGAYSGTLTFEIVFAKGFEDGSISSLTYSNDDQTVWSESGEDGVFQTMTPTLTPCDATGSYTSADLPDGLSLNSSSGLITVGTFSSLPTGESTFTVTFTGSGTFTGSAGYLITITKRELWTPAQGLDGGTVLVGFDFSQNVTSASNLISSVGSEYGESINATQADDDAKAIVGTMQNGKVCAVFTGDNALEFTLSSPPDRS